ncbi:MAG: cytochrome c oxidase subunit II [Candidatus Tectomicrobia bacterium]|uniref:Cytochrome c oxidase subunit 2 n=1 Tax=Tectimicrobiota bacterium TaxID=2528274 RepID=A0A932I137_UNCTE|nr:cytochrome c oxidase subunit II [Candidatus Tectomicrobia bacterium]
MMSWLPENISLEGVEIDRLFYISYYLTAVTFILVAAFMLAFIVMYRQKPGVRAKYTHGNTTLEILWTVIPAVILLAFILVSQNSWARLKFNPPENPDIRVEVTGKQFNWIIRYPGPDGKFGTADDKEFDNQLNVPVNKKVLIHLKGEDVIHSFFMPEARLKADVVPGRTIPLWFTLTKTGKFEIPCAELCGFGHSGMKGELVVHTSESFQDWLKKTWAPPQQASRQ